MWQAAVLVLLAAPAVALSPRAALRQAVGRVCRPVQGPFGQFGELVAQDAAVAVTNGPAALGTMGGAIDSSEAVEGSIFLDHTETVGAGRLTMDMPTQTSVLGQVNGTSLSPTPDQTVVFTRPSQPPALLAARVGLDVTLRQQSVGLAASYGLTDHLDVSVLFPLVYTSVSVTAFRQTTQQLDRQGRFVPVRAPTRRATVTGTGFSQGDLTARLKQSLPSLGSVRFAAVLAAQFPTGEPELLTGTGGYWLLPSVDASWAFWRERGLLNVNVGSIIDLSGTGDSRMAYGLGAGVGLIPKRLAAIVEFLGQSQFQAVTTTLETNVLTLTARQFKQAPIFGITFGRTDEFDLAVGLRGLLGTAWAIGAEEAAPGGLALFAAAVIPLNDAGLRPTGPYAVVGIGTTF